MLLIIEYYHYLIVFQFYLKNKKLLGSIYFCQSPPLIKILCISILDTFVGLLPPSFWTLPIVYLTWKSIKLLFNLDQLKIKKLSFGQYTKCPSKHFKTYFKNLAYVYCFLKISWSCNALSLKWDTVKV